MNSDRPSTMRFGYVAEPDVGDLAESGGSRAGGSRCPRRPGPPPASRRSPPRRRARSAATSFSASSSRPWMNIQRGDSGTLRRTSRMTRPSTAPSPKARRQPRSGGKMLGVEQEHRQHGAERRAQPVRAVDGQVDHAAASRRDQLVDRRVDGRVLAADAGAGEEPADEEDQRRERECGRDRCRAGRGRA